MIATLDERTKDLFTVSGFAEAGPWFGLAFTVLLFAAIWWLT